MFKELIKKIELQSVLVLFITIVFGYFLLRLNQSIKSISGCLGLASISMGLLYTFGSFFSNQIKENYKDVILEYQSTITILKSGYKDISGNYQKQMKSFSAPTEKYSDSVNDGSETKSE